MWSLVILFIDVSFPLITMIINQLWAHFVSAVITKQRFSDWMLKFSFSLCTALLVPPDWCKCTVCEISDAALTVFTLKLLLFVLYIYHTTDLTPIVFE